MLSYYKETTYELQWSVAPQCGYDSYESDDFYEIQDKFESLESQYGPLDEGGWYCTIIER
jgi:hypothetical protein